MDHVAHSDFHAGRAADPDVGARTSSLHQSPLLLAVARGHAAAVAALLDAGANCAVLVATSRDPAATPDNLLDIARARRDHDTLQLLMAHADACDVSAADLPADR